MGMLQEPGDGGVGLRVGAAVGGLYVILSVPEPAGVRSSQLQGVREWGGAMSLGVLQFCAFRGMAVSRNRLTSR